MKKDNERGLLSLEACIAVTIFIFLMLFMYSYFVVFEARNAVAHAMLATANSLSLDAYASNTLRNDEVMNAVFDSVYGQAANILNDFNDNRKWYDDSVVENGNGGTELSADFSDVIQKRFYAYLGGGDSGRAAAILDRYHIKDGKDGLDFSGSYVDSDDRLHLSVRYTIQYEFQVFHLNDLDMEQSVCSRLWK